MKPYKHISFEERFTIEKLLKREVSIRRIADLLERSPSTISYEIKRNSVKGIYDATKANHKAYFKRYRSKRQCLKVAMDRFLSNFVEKKLREKWSPEQISGYLKEVYDITCSDKAIYKYVSKRCLERYLFWSWNRKKSGRKRYHAEKQYDGRKYIHERPTIDSSGHYEMDFIVSRQSSWVLLVVVDIITKHTFVRKLPNRKHTTLCRVLSSIFCGHSIKSITTDNDIAFNCWKTLEEHLNTTIYFTEPYCSWQKGLVENTNRWIRCFVPKKRDIQSVTDEEMNEIHTFINDRPRAVIDFKIPSEYYYKLSGVRVEG